MNKNIVNVCAGLGLTMMSSAAMAESAPVMFSSINGFSAPASNEVKGARLTVFHGAAVSVTGVDFALLGLSEATDVTGVNWGLLGANRVHGEFTGASFGLLNWHNGNDTGANLGFINVTNNVTGANISAVNYSEGYTMVDVGVANLSSNSVVQVGLFNMTSDIKGVQVGLINCAENGFFPCFPFVNFAL
ncbi:VC2662 family protein [Moritella sp. F3]|uniref:VC2662 family protein n=1 Tax=Moritella sp. F3 TaxID=2718882 RepID=UPI0018E1CCC2|nr:phaC PHA synthase [Moritella sp. F3]GIC76233.1 hypothetical protein FMO001_09600 [Moritella sp. F1]GIC82979.1 hypothetical protein FMO003_32590 [Moritella sp. F3]